MKKNIKNFEGQQKVIFIGAGISANPPTFFPIAGSIISQLLKAIAPDDESLKDLFVLADSKRNCKRNPGDYIRFELLLDIIQQIADKELSILKMVDIFNEPNPLHFLLAKRAMMGDIVVTTNFDSLIEEAIQRLGRKPFTVCRVSEYAEWKKIALSGKVTVFKLHGSYKQYNGCKRYLALDTVQATLGSVTAGLTDLVLPEEKRNFLIEISRGCQMLIAGYSGSDDLDIMPTFHSLEPSSLMWLEHDISSKKPCDVTEKMRISLKNKTPERLTSKNLFLRSLLTKGKTRLKIFQANSPIFFKMLFKDMSDIENNFSGRDSKVERLENFLNSWEKKYLDKKHIKFMIIGHIMMNLSRFEEAYRNFTKARASCGNSTHIKDRVHTAFLISVTQTINS